MKLNKLIPLTFAAVLGLAACGGGGGSSSQGSSQGSSQQSSSQGSSQQSSSQGSSQQSSSQGSSQQSSSQGGGGEGVEVTVWATAAEEAVVNAVLERYNATANGADKIRVKYVAVDEGSAGTEVAKNPSAEAAPELFLVADDQIYGLQSKNIVVDITEDYGDKIKANNTAVAVESSSYGGSVYGFPVTSDNGYFLWYDSALASAQDVATLEGLLAKAREVHKQVFIEIENGWYAPTFFFAPQVCGTTSLTFHENSEGAVVYDVTWDNAKGVACAQYIANLFEEYADVLTSGDNAAMVAGFEADQLLAGVRGTWMEKDLQDICETIDATKLPTFNNGCQMATFTGSKVYCLNGAKTGADAQQKLIAAAKLADLLTEKEAQLIRFEKRATGPCNKEAIQDARYTEHVTMGLAALTAQCAAAAAVQATSAEGRYWDVGAAIGTAFVTNDLGEYDTWQEFLTGECNIIREA